MQPSKIAELAGGLAAGGLTAESITEEYGEGILTQVLALGAGFGVGSLAVKVMKETGVSDLIDDVFNIF